MRWTVICAKGGYASRDANDQEDGEAEEIEEGGLRALRVLRVGATSFGRGTFLGKLVDYVSFYLGWCGHWHACLNSPTRSLL